MGFKLKEKLKRLKSTLKQWNKETYGDVDFKIKLLVDSIKALDLRGEQVGLSQEEMTEGKTTL